MQCGILGKQEVKEINKYNEYFKFNIHQKQSRFYTNCLPAEHNRLHC